MAVFDFLEQFPAFAFIPDKKSGDIGSIGAKTKLMKEKRGIYTGIIEKDENGNYFCGEYLLDYQYTEASFKLGDEINIKSVIANPSDKSYNQYPKKSRNFFLANDKK